MPALFSSSFVKVIIVLISSFIINVGNLDLVSTEVKIPFISVTVDESSDSLKSEEKEAADLEEQKRDLEEQKEEREKLKQSVKISISDDGIKVESGDEDEFILDKKGLKSIVKRGIDAIPDSIAINLDLYDEDRYKHVISSDRVRVGESIHIKEYEMVQGDVVSVFGDVRIDGKVRGDVVSVLGNVRLGDRSSVNGDVVCVLGDMDKSHGATVRGQTINVGGGRITPITGPFLPFGSGIFKFFSRIASFIISLLVLLLVLYFMPERVDRSGDFARTSFLKSLGVGALIVIFGSIFVLLVAVIIGITIIGIPLSILLILCYIVFLIIGYFVAAYTLGKALCRRMRFQSSSIYLYGLVGLFLLAIFGIVSSAMSVIPFLTPFRVLIEVTGKFIGFIALLVGVGAFVLSKGGSLRPGPETPVEE